VVSAISRLPSREHFPFDAFSSREPVPTSLENAIGTKTAVHAPLPPPVSRFKRPALIVEAILYAILGGLAFDFIGVPAGLISGSMLAVAIAALAGRPVPFPKLFGQITFVVLGIALGATVTPEQLQGIVTYPLSVLFLLTATLAIIAATTAYLQYVHGWDRLSALLGSSPGAVSQTVAIAVEMKANIQGVVVVQTFRAILLAAAVGPALAALGVLPPAHGSANLPAAAPLPLALTFVVGTLVGIGFLKLRFPGGLLFGAMIGSAALHGSGLVTGGLPILLRDAAMILIGDMIGGRLANVSPRIFVTYLIAAVGAVAVSILMAALFISTAIALGTPPAGTIIAYMPGAMDTMMILALAMSLDPVFVGAHHLARVLMISLLIPTLVRLLFGRTPKETPPPDEPLD
jgi:membrane AbrB-like protein